MIVGPFKFQSSHFKLRSLKYNTLTVNSLLFLIYSRTNDILFIGLVSL